MRKPPSSKIVVGVMALVALIIGMASFNYFWPAPATLTLSGEVQAREIKNGSRFGGRVNKLLVREGDEVKQGQLLILFDDTDLQAQISDARAALKQAIAQESLLAKGADIGQVRQAGSAVEQARERLKIVATGARSEEIAQAKSKVIAAETQSKQAQQTFENAKVMLEEGIISKQKYESLQEGLHVAEGNLQAAQASLRMLQSGGRPEEKKIATSQLSAARAQYGQVLKGARPEEVSIASANVEKARSTLSALEAQLDEVRIKAPFPGIVSVIGVTEGELVPPGRPVISILDYGHLWVDVYVPESKLAMVKPGGAVTVKAKSYKNSEFPGRVALINPKSEFIPVSGGDANSEESTFRVKIGVSGQDASGKTPLYPGMKVDVLLTK
ncbi:MAG TPA: efflux RND transporter periplasmic adaptor subunit [Coleofasciculaceae cyanobacterium]|jgi:HlyD family secretion protein